MSSLRLAPLSLVAAIAVVALPVVSIDDSPPSATSVAAEVTEVDMATRSVGGGAQADLSLQRTVPFSMVAVSWERASVSAVAVEVRTRSSGEWSTWTEMGVADAFPDGGTADSAGLRDATTPLWTGPAEGVEVRATSAAGKPRDLRVDLIDPGTSPADAQLGSATGPVSSALAASDARPTIISRAEWGADESLRLAECPEGPKYTDPPKVGFVHHTASGNDYSAETTAAAIRGIYAYSVNTRGYCDIPYNFIVDKFGRIFEGRYGGVDAPVLSAATGGFNTATFAVVALGTYSTVGPTAAMVDSIGTMVGWKLGRYGRDPLGQATLTAAGGAGTTSRYVDGTAVTIPTVSGHRQVGSTECPGNLLFPHLDTIRGRASAMARVTPLIPPPEGVRAFVKALYADYLGRPAVDSEVTPWADVVYRGVTTRQGAAKGFTGSPEWTRSRVVDLYQGLLARSPDAAGLDSWARLLGEDPARLAMVTAGFYGSQEWYLRAGGTDPAWVEALYRAVLGRALDPAGRASWVQAIPSLGRQGIALAILQAPESLERRVGAVYRTFLGRSAEPGGVAYWSPFVAAQGDIVLSNAIAASEEYFDRAALRFPKPTPPPTPTA